MAEWAQHVRFWKAFSFMTVVQHKTRDVTVQFSRDVTMHLYNTRCSQVRGPNNQVTPMETPPGYSLARSAECLIASPPLTLYYVLCVCESATNCCPCVRWCLSLLDLSLPLQWWRPWVHESGEENAPPSVEWTLAPQGLHCVASLLGSSGGTESTLGRHHCMWTLQMSCCLLPPPPCLLPPPCCPLFVLCCGNTSFLSPPCPIRPPSCFFSNTRLTWKPCC